MVQVSKMLLGLAAMFALAAVPTVAEKAPAFDVPTFDYTQLAAGSTPDDVLAALKKDGIISFTNVPNYATVRQAYLDTAAACSVSAQETNAEFLLHKTLTDGTNRFTISMPSGQDADPSAVSATTEAACPGYAAVYSEFSSLLEWVVLSVATTLDATAFSTQDGDQQTVSSRKLMTDAVRLDHFHAYEAPTDVAQRRRLAREAEDDLSLALHEDDGMFIVFATPSFYKVSSDDSKGKLEPVDVGGEDDSDTGLVIQTSAGQRVRPVLKPDAVTLMVGTGYSRWVSTSEALPAVMHGMRMPEVATAEGERLLRAWFGKMTLLPAYQRMLGQLSFEEHANTTTRFVQQGHETDRQLLGCAPGRSLVASADAECSFNECSVKPGATEPADGCPVVCNRSHSTDPALCAESCVCTTSAHSATVCWMLCVKDLDTCSSDDQTCSGQQRVCESTPVPTTSPPVTTPAPITASPTPTSPPVTTPTPTTASPTTTSPPVTTPTPTTDSPTPTSTTSAPGDSDTPAPITEPPTATTEPGDSTPSPSGSSSEDRDNDKTPEPISNAC